MGMAMAYRKKVFELERPKASCAQLRQTAHYTVTYYRECKLLIASRQAAMGPRHSLAACTSVFD